MQNSEGEMVKRFVLFFSFAHTDTNELQRRRKTILFELSSTKQQM